MGLIKIAMVPQMKDAPVHWVILGRAVHQSVSARKVFRRVMAAVGPIHV
jgi:3-keto-L-gulonate-6-phosphate decarboxylase